MRSFATILVSLALATSAFGQWDQIQLLPNLSQDSDHGGSPLYSGGGDVVFAANGDILVFYTENGAFTTFPNGTPAKVKMARSTDGGVTWNEPFVILQAGANGVQDLGPALAAVNPTSGRITLVFFNRGGSAPTFQVEDQTWHSDDNGETWTRAGKASDYAETGGRLEYSPGGLLIYSYGIFTPSEAIVFKTSSDDGATWSTRSQITAPPSGYCDHALGAISDTEWIVYWSNCFFGTGGTTTLTELHTTDGGATWSDPVAAFTRGSSFFTAVELVVASDNTLWLVNTDGPIIQYRTSDDAGASWSEAQAWTGGTKDGQVECTDAAGILEKRGQVGTAPLCAFVAQGRSTDDRLPEIYLGQPGVSTDPLLTVGTEDVRTGIPESFTLSQNYPNPFNPSTTVPFELERPQHVSLTLYDALGRNVGSLAGGVMSAGQHNVTVDASQLPSGVYIYRLHTEDGVASRVMTVGK